MGVYIGVNATIVKGVLAGMIGKVVAAHSNDKTVTIRLDEYCTIETSFDNIVQGRDRKPSTCATYNYSEGNPFRGEKRW